MNQHIKNWIKSLIIIGIVGIIAFIISQYELMIDYSPDFFSIPNLNDATTRNVFWYFIAGLIGLSWFNLWRKTSKQQNTVKVKENSSTLI